LYNKEEDYLNYPLLANQMPERIKGVWRLTDIVSSLIALLLGGIVIIALTYFNWFNTIWYWIAVIYFSIIIVLTVFSLLLVPYRYKFHRFEINSTELAFQEGYIFRKITFVPINRIQHIETEQGPFLRRAQLMEVVVTTAATSHRISGLDIDDAQALRQQIVDFVKVAKEDV